MSASENSITAAASSPLDGSKMLFKNCHLQVEWSGSNFDGKQHFFVPCPSPPVWILGLGVVVSHVLRVARVARVAPSRRQTRGLVYLFVRIWFSFVCLSPLTCPRCSLLFVVVSLGIGSCTHLTPPLNAAEVWDFAPVSIDKYVSDEHRFARIKTLLDPNQS